MRWTSWLPALAGYAAVLLMLLWLQGWGISVPQLALFTLGYALAWSVLRSLGRRKDSAPDLW